MKPYTTLFAAAGAKSTMTGLDWLAIALYFGVLFCVAWWVVKRRKDTAADYFLAGRNLSWWIIGASIFASNIGSEHIVGLAGSGAKDGVAMAHYELHAWCLLVLAWVFVPFYARSLVFTMPEFLERRFSTQSRYVLSIVSLITFIISKIAVGIFAGGLVFQHAAAGTPDRRSAGQFLVGRVHPRHRADRPLYRSRRDACGSLQRCGAGLCLDWRLRVADFLRAPGAGWSGERLREICGSDMFNLWKPLTPPGMESTWAPVKEAHRIAWYFNTNFPWLGMAICAPVIGLWYWCTDQYIVQRALGAPNERVARQGSIFAAFLKLFPVYLFIIPGLICYALAKSHTNPGLNEEFFGPNARENPYQVAFPLMVQHLLPAGLARTLSSPVCSRH